jgi:hypothetical protein
MGASQGLWWHQRTGMHFVYGIENVKWHFVRHLAKRGI